MRPNALLAQFFTEYQSSQIQWPSGGYARYQTLQNPGHSKEVKIVSTLDVRSAQSDGFLDFQLPGGMDVLQAEATLITDDSTNGFIWSGKLINAPGYVAFIHRQGKTAGFIQVGKDFYEISPIDDDYQFLIKRNNDYSPSNGCGVDDSPQEPPPPGPNDCSYAPEYNTCPALITVLLILTPEAKDIVENMYGSVDLFALLGQVSVNSAFWNSDIPNKEIRVKWVVKSGFSFNPSMDYNVDLTQLVLFSEPERSNNKADLVVFAPHVDYPGIAGVANLPDPPNPNQAFSIVEAKTFLSHFVFAHELGHNLGCRHNWPFDLGNDQTKVCAHAKRWLPINTITPDWYQEIDSWRTLMGVPVAVPSDWVYTIDDEEIILHILSDHSILHYSNPTVSYNGEPTGRATEPQADNADHIRKVGCEISNYNAANELALNISASPCSDPISLTATITPPDSGLPGVGPYTVHWFWNTSGIFDINTPFQFLGTGTTLNLSDHPACPFFWVKCIVVSSDNVAISRILKVTVSPCLCKMNERPGRNRDAISSTLPSNSLTLFPNPVSQDFLFVQTQETSKETLLYEVVNIWGEQVSSGKMEQLDETQLSLSVEGLNDGLYFLRIQKPNAKQENHKFIIAKTH